jgi:hypothetical protein
MVFCVSDGPSSPPPPPLPGPALPPPAAASPGGLGVDERSRRQGAASGAGAAPTRGPARPPRSTATGRAPGQRDARDARPPAGRATASIPASALALRIWMPIKKARDQGHVTNNGVASKLHPRHTTGAAGAG